MLSACDADRMRSQCGEHEPEVHAGSSCGVCSCDCSCGVCAGTLGRVWESVMLC